MKTDPLCLITIDGFTGAGKTTYAQKFKEIGASILHADDFFYPEGEKRHPLSGNFNAPRFIREVLPHLYGGEGFFLKAYDCKTKTYKKRYVPPAKLYVLEGSYTSTPLLDAVRREGIFLRTPTSLRHKRLKRREGKRAEVFFQRWEPMERAFVRKFKPHKTMKDRSEFI